MSINKISQICGKQKVDETNPEMNHFSFSSKKNEENNNVIKIIKNSLDLEIDEISALEGVRLTRIKKKINSSSWSNELEDLMRSWGEKAAGNREMHDNAASKWRKFSNKLYIPILFMTTVTGVSNFSVASTLHYELIMYVMGTLNILCAFLTGILKFYKPDKKAENHATTARSFGSFYRNVTLELGMSREERSSSDELAKWAKNEYDRMQQNAPPLSKAIINEFIKTHPNQVNLPDVALNTFHIEIHGRK